MKLLEDQESGIRIAITKPAEKIIRRHTDFAKFTKALIPFLKEANARQCNIYKSHKIIEIEIWWK